MQAGADTRKHATELPRLVLFHNQWTNFRSEEIAAQFRRITAKEARAIVVGDEVWLDREPYHPHGKVYGYERVRVTKVERFDAGKSIRVHCDSGFTTIELRKNGHNSCVVVDNSRALAALVAANPACTVVNPWL